MRASNKYRVRRISERQLLPNCLSAPGNTERPIDIDSDSLLIQSLTWADWKSHLHHVRWQSVRLCEAPTEHLALNLSDVDLRGPA